MSLLDYAVIGVMGVSIAWGIWRGLVREVMSLAGLVIAFLAANLFAAPLSETFSPTMRAELRVLFAYLAIFVGTLFLAGIAAFLLGKIISAVGLGTLDHSLGALFGVARGLVVLVAFALGAGLTSLPRHEAWTESASGPALARTAVALKPWLPPAFAERMRYH